MILYISSKLLNTFVYSNAITNGNFNSGSTGWSATSATISASNNILTVTATGAGASPYALTTSTLAVSSGKKIFIAAKMLVTNSSCNSLDINAIGSTGGTLTSVVIKTLPTINQQYIISGVLTTPADFSGNYRVRFYQKYADAATANGKVMQLQEAFIIDLTSLYGTGNEPSAADCANIFRFVDGTTQPNFSKQIAT